MSAESAPIKVLSKRAQIEKHLQKVKQQVSQTISTSPVNNNSTTTTAPVKRRAQGDFASTHNLETSSPSMSTPPFPAADILSPGLDSNSSLPPPSAPASASSENDVIRLLKKLEKQQKEQKNLLEKISKDQKKHQQKAVSSGQVVKKSKIESRKTPLVGPLEFQHALTNLLDSWKQIPSSEKQQFMVSTLDTLPHDQKQILNAFLCTAATHSNTPSPASESFCSSPQDETLLINPSDVHSELYNPQEQSQHNLQSFVSEFWEQPSLLVQGGDLHNPDDHLQYLSSPVPNSCPSPLKEDQNENY